GEITDITAADTLTIQGSLLADGTGAGGFPGAGGRTQLRACTLEGGKEAKLSTTGEGTYPWPSNVLQASGQMTVAGPLAAGDRNRLEYRANPPMTVAGAAITPDADIRQHRR